jgi:hypothetical protein
VNFYFHTAPMYCISSTMQQPKPIQQICYTEMPLSVYHSSLLPDGFKSILLTKYNHFNGDQLNIVANIKIKNHFINKRTQF